MGRRYGTGLAAAAAVALLCCGGPQAGAACRPAPGTASQLVTVAPADAATRATVRLWQRAGGCWRPVAGPWAARVGRNGLSARHREGDGTTPTGRFALGPVVYGVASDPGTRLRYHRLVCGDWWDEDPSSPTYNTFRHVRCGATPPFGGQSEALWRSPVAYSHFAVVRYNDAPARPGRGSAIFVHADTGRATAGCVSLSLPRLVALLRWLRPDPAPLIEIGTL